MKCMKIALIILGMCACLKAPHENEYDPENPNKAYLGGTAYKFDGTTLANVDIKLYYLDTTLYDETKSDNDGDYYFEDVDPSIYMLTAKFGYFAPFEIDSCDLPAETYNDTLDIWIGHMFFPFEEENLGTIEPRGFKVVVPTAAGWAIVDDPSDPDKHSAPRVYAGNVTGINSGSVVLNEQLRNFSADARLKVINLTNHEWKAGILFRYQNPANFYAANIERHRVDLIKMESGAVTHLASDTSKIFNPNQWYCLSIDCCDDSLHLSINCEPVLGTADNTYDEGLFGLRLVNNDASETAVLFDDIDIWP